MFKNWQLLIAENERKSKSKFVPQDFTEISPRTVLDVAFIFRNVSALKGELFLLITDFYMHPVSLFSIQHNIQVGLSNYPTYIQFSRILEKFIVRSLEKVMHNKKVYIIFQWKSKIYATFNNLHCMWVSDLLWFYL